jgi:hypothetical protein
MLISSNLKSVKNDIHIWILLTSYWLNALILKYENVFIFCELD